MFLEKNITMTRMADNAFVVTGMWCYAPKLWTFLIKSSEIQECILYFKNPAFVTLRENQKIIMENKVKYVKETQKYLLFQYVLLFLDGPQDLLYYMKIIFRSMCGCHLMLQKI